MTTTDEQLRQAKINLYAALLDVPREQLRPNEAELCFYLSLDKQVQDHLGLKGEKK